MIKVTQINLNRAREAQDLLEDRTRKEGTDICIINEANLRISERKKTKDEGWITDEEADAVVWINNNEIRVKKTEIRRGITLVETEGGLCIISCYFSPNQSILEYEDYTERLEEIIEARATNHLIVAGDFNASSFNWGSSRTNTRGLCLKEVAARQGLFLLNNGKKPTFSRNGPNGTRQETYLDIAFSTKPSNVQSWMVRDDLESMSDHLYVDMEIQSTEGIRLETRQLRWSFNKMDRETLRHFIDEECRKLSEEDRFPDEEIITDILSKACEGAQPKASKHSNSRKPVYWWPSEIATLRKECIRARRNYTRSKARSAYARHAEQYKHEYIVARDKYKWGIVGAKRNKWKELCEEVRRDVWGHP